MYSKEEAISNKKEFWTKFGFFSQTKRESLGLEKKWLAHNTGINSVNLKFDFEKKQALVGIEINTNNLDEEQKYYNRFLDLKNIIDNKFEESPIWNPDFKTESGKYVCKIYHIFNNVNINDKSCWPGVFQFFFNYMSIYESFYNEFMELIQDS